MHHRIAITILAAAAISIPASAGRIVVNSDEWTTDVVGQTNAGAGNYANFATNLGSFLAGPGGRILIHSANPFLNDPTWIAALTAAGFQVTAGVGAFDPANYDAIMLATPSFATLDATELAAFVNGGGGVYVAGGNNTPVGAQTNPFLNQFGLNIGPLNSFVATDAIDNPAHPLFSGVTQLYYANGNIVSLFGANPHASIIERSNTTANHALIAVYDDVQPVSSNVPEPSSFLLAGFGLMALGCRRFVRRKAALAAFASLAIVAAANAQTLRCDTVDTQINAELAKAKDYYKRANELAASIRDNTIANAASQIVSTLNPIPTSGADVAEGLFWKVCGYASRTVAGGLEMTKKALEISAAIGSTQTGGVQGMIQSNRTLGEKAMNRATEMLQWKKEHCTCNDDTTNPPKVNDPPTGNGSGTLEPIEFSNGGNKVIIREDRRSAEFQSDCRASNKRVQLKSTGTWSTKSTGPSDPVLDKLQPGIEYSVRVRCDGVYSSDLQFTIPKS